MKLTKRGDSNFTIEGIKPIDIKYSNLGARPTKSIYYDPERPQHVFVIWLDKDVADELAGCGFNVSETEDAYNQLGLRPFIQFKAYPKVRPNPISAKEEQHPKVILKTGSNTIRISEKSFGLIDSAMIRNVDISFHSWKYDDHRPPVAALDGLWCEADESAGGRNDYFDVDYGYSEPDFEPDEVPFQ